MSLSMQTDKGGSCRDTTKLQEWKNIWRKLVKMDEHQLYAETGCMANCKRKEWAMSKIFEDNRSGNNASVIGIAMFYTNGRYQVGNQYYTYDFNTFVANFGGYLGLLLGYSIESFFDMAQDIFNYLMKKVKEQVNVEKRGGVEPCIYA